MDKELFKTTGIVTNIQKDTFHVTTDSGLSIACYISGKLRKYNIRICVQDKVEIEVSGYDYQRGRITKRF